MANGTCSIGGCENLENSRGWCRMHYMRWWRHGDPSVRLLIIGLDFWERVDKNGPDGFHFETGENLGPCWLWTAGVDAKGYGICSLARRACKAHRVAYERTNGPIPNDWPLDHLCRVHGCVRPSHLEAVPTRTNILRGQSPAAEAAARSECIHGHLFDQGNTIIRRNGTRQCRACKKFNAAAARRRPGRRAA